MPVPVSYTEAMLADYMVAVLDTTAAALGWESDAPAITEAVNEVDGLLGGDLAGATDIVKVRALARWQAWKAARGAVANQVNLASGTDRLDRAAWFDHVDRELYAAAEAAAAYPEGASALGGGPVRVTQIDDASDPYGWPVVAEFG